MRSTPSMSLALLASAALAVACQVPSREAGPGGGAASRSSGGGKVAGQATSAASGWAWAPRPAPVVIPEGASLPVALETSLSSAVNKVGDTVVGKLVSEVTAEGRVLAPAGSEVRGRVTAAVDSGRVKGRARLAFVFDTLVVKGRPNQIATRAIDITADSSRNRDAAIIGGSAVAGGIIGAIADGKGGAGKGVLIGGAAGTGAVLATKGKQVTLPAGTQFNVQLTGPARLG